MARNPLRNTKDELRLESRDSGVRAEPRSIPRRIYVICVGRPLHLQQGNDPSMLPDSDGFLIPIVFGRLVNQWNLESSGIFPRTWNRWFPILGVLIIVPPLCKFDV